MSIDDPYDRSITRSVYLELSDGQSHKFYEVRVDGAAVTIRYGRIGTAGQSSTSTYATAEKAQTEATKKINEKLRKGYLQHSSEMHSQLSQPTALSQETPMTIETTYTPQFLQDLPPQFEPLRSFLETNLVPYIKFTATDAGHLNSAGYGGSDWSGDPLELWQSKIGGHPYLPKGTSYPTDAETGEMMMLLMQINCGDLPMIESLNLPRQGLLQFYIGLDVAMSGLSPERHHVLYYPDVSEDKNDLTTDFSFLADSASSLEWYDNVYTLSFSAQRDVFWKARQQLDDSFEVPEHLIELCEELDEWISDYEDEATDNRQRMNKLGGYPELHSEVEETIGEAKGHLLLELQHDFNGDDHFYFYIEASDLASLSFNNIESYFVRS